MKLSVVMPAYNEEGSIEEAVRDVQRCVFSIVPDSQLIVINDGSKDNTGKILDRLACEEHRIRVINRQNGGHGRAVRTGLDAAEGEFIFQIDSDRQMPLDDFQKLWQAARSRDGAYGIRATRNDSRLRIALSAVLRLLIRLLYGVDVPDANVPCKLVRREAWLEAKNYIAEDSAIPSILLAIILAYRGYDIETIPWPHVERSSGKCSIRSWKLVKYCWSSLSEILLLRLRMNKTPLAECSPN
jgi:dolichol-phosphate mannosyltransferase